MGYYYSWTGNFTDDPRFKDTPLPYGKDQWVLLDGVDYSPVMKCETGNQGWIEVVKRDEGGDIIFGPDGIETEVKYGKVEYLLPGDLECVLVH